MQQKLTMFFKNSIILAVFLTFSMTSLVNASLYDPHVFPESGPYFEGWYMRISDFDTGDSLGLLFGNVLPLSTKNTSGPLVVASILLRKCGPKIGCKLTSVNGKFNQTDLNVTVDGHSVTENPDKLSPANFKWTVNAKNNGGYFEQNGDTTTFTFELGELTFRGEATNPFPWNNRGTGPEGWLINLPLPLHWFVFSLRSELKYYELQNTTSVDAYLIGFRDPQNDLSLDFRPDNSIITTSINGCNGEVNISVNSISYNVEININAKIGSYSNCLLGPEVEGFRPACVESYDATTIFKISKRSWIPFMLMGEKVFTFINSALEFGGSNVCNEKCS